MCEWKARQVGTATWHQQPLTQSAHWEKFHYQYRQFPSWLLDLPQVLVLAMPLGTSSHWHRVHNGILDLALGIGTGTGTRYWHHGHWHRVHTGKSWHRLKCQISLGTGYWHRHWHLESWPLTQSAHWNFAAVAMIPSSDSSLARAHKLTVRLGTGYWALALASLTIDTECTLGEAGSACGDKFQCQPCRLHTLAVGLGCGNGTGTGTASWHHCHCHRAHTGIQAI